MFKKLFQPIFSSNKIDVKEIYNNGVNQLAKGHIDSAIELFEKVCNEHPSAAYNLGLIYLDGAGKFTPKYELARKYFRLANDLGHPKAKQSSIVIGLEGDRKITVEEYQMLFPFAVTQYALGDQFGNLAYLIANDIKKNVLETSSNEWYSFDRFLSYELYCIRNYANEEVLSLYENSSLVNGVDNYTEDWEGGETAVISDYLNEKVIPSIIALSDGKVNFFEMGRLRLAIVNTVYEYYF